MSTRGSNTLYFNVCAALGMSVPATWAFEVASIIAIALVDVDKPQRHSALRAERASIRHLKRRATMALQRHTSPPTGSAKAPRRLTSDRLNEAVSAAPVVVTII